LQKQVDQRMKAYETSIQTLKGQVGDSPFLRFHEGNFYASLAQRKLAGQGFFRSSAQRSQNLGVVVAAGMIAKSQEKAAANEAIRLLDTALSYDDAPYNRLIKASIHQALGQKDIALKEVNYIIDTFPNDDAYVEARKLKDELEAKKGPCFVATACYGSYDHPDVVLFRQWRDNILLMHPAGRIFVRWYYKFSPPLANRIQKIPAMACAIRRYCLEPLARKLK
jgi:tetratricopeptide (TPR) repeat protein